MIYVCQGDITPSLHDDSRPTLFYNNEKHWKTLRAIQALQKLCVGVYWATGLTYDQVQSAISQVSHQNVSHPPYEKLAPHDELLIRNLYGRFRWEGIARAHVDPPFLNGPIEGRIPWQDLPHCMGKGLEPVLHLYTG